MLGIKINKAPLIGVCGVLWSVFHLYTGFFGLLAPLQQRPIHVMFALVLAFLIYPLKSSWDKSKLYIDQIVAIVAAIVMGVYITYNHFELSLNIGMYTNFEVVLSGIGVVLVLEATRRLTGWALPLIALVFVGYEFAGPYMPNAIRHPGIGIEQLLTFQTLTTESIYGIAVDVSAAFIFLFILYARFLQETGGGQVFIDLASSLVGHVRGGPAKVAVLGSCFFGSISGSAVANVAGTGSFTIPLMKRTGYTAPFAGAVEAVASSGGQFMPPIMGSAAFLISEIVGLPYWKVALYAAVPAVLYYLAVFFMVDFEAGKLKLVGLKKTELPKTKDVLAKGWPALVSPVILVFMLAVLQWSPAQSAVWAIVATVVVSAVNKNTRLNGKKIYDCMVGGATGAIDTALACACVGMVIGAVTQTGLALKLSGVLVSLAGGNLLALLVLTMLACLVLGMGLPTVACYLVLAVMVAPAVVDMGVPKIAAHLFIFYFGIISNITPPVALASYVAAGIAEAKFLPTSLIACRLGASAFILPFMFCYNPGLILQGDIGNIIQCVTTATIGIYSLSVGLEGYCRDTVQSWQRAMFIIAAALLIFPEGITDIVGVALFVGAMALHITQTKNKQKMLAN